MPSSIAPAAGEDVPTARTGAARVDRQDHGLRAEFVAQFGDQLGAMDGGGVDADLVRAGVDDAARVLDAADAAADGERDEDLARGAVHDVHHGVAVVAGGGDVEEHEFVGALFVVARGEFDGIAGVA